MGTPSSNKPQTQLSVSLVSKPPSALHRAAPTPSLAPNEIQRAQADPRHARPEAILALQRTIGNQAVQRLLAAHPLPSPAIQRQIIKHETTNGRVFYLDLEEAQTAVMDKMGSLLISTRQKQIIKDHFESQAEFSVDAVVDALRPKVPQSEMPKSNKIISKPKIESPKIKKEYDPNQFTIKAKKPRKSYHETMLELQAAVMEEMKVDELTEEQELAFVEMASSNEYTIPQMARRLRKLESQFTPLHWVAEAKETFALEKDMKERKKLEKREKEIGRGKSSTRKDIYGTTLLDTTDKVTPLFSQLDSTTGNHDPNLLGTLNSGAKTIKSVVDVGQDIKVIKNTKGEERKEACKELAEDTWTLTKNTLSSAVNTTTTIKDLGGGEAAKNLPFIKVVSDGANVIEDSAQVGKNLTKVVTTSGKERKKAAKKLVKHGGEFIKDSASMAGSVGSTLEQTGATTALGMVPIVGAVTGGISAAQDSTQVVKGGIRVWEQKKIRKEAKARPFQEALAAALQSFIDASEIGMAKDGVKALGDVGTMVGSILTASGIGAVAGVPIGAIGVGLNLATDSADKVRDYWKAHKANDAVKEFDALKEIRNDPRLAAQIILGYARAERARLSENEKPNPQEHPALCALKSLGIDLEDLDEESDEVLRSKMLGKVGKQNKKSTTLTQDLRKTKEMAKKFNPLDVTISDKDERKEKKLTILMKLKNLLDRKEKRDSNWVWERMNNWAEEKIDLDIQAAINKLNNESILTKEESKKLADLEEIYNELIGKSLRFDTNTTVINHNGHNK